MADLRINELQSRVQLTDSRTILDPHVMREIVRACIKAVKDDQALEKRLADDRRIRSADSSDSW